MYIDQNNKAVGSEGRVFHHDLNVSKLTLTSTRTFVHGAQYDGRGYYWGCNNSREIYYISSAQLNVKGSETPTLCAVCPDKIKDRLYLSSNRASRLYWTRLSWVMDSGGPAQGSGTDGYEGAVGIVDWWNYLIVDYDYNRIVGRYRTGNGIRILDRDSFALVFEDASGTGGSDTFTGIAQDEDYYYVARSGGIDVYNKYTLVIDESYDTPSYISFPSEVIGNSLICGAKGSKRFTVLDKNSGKIKFCFNDTQIQFPTTTDGRNIVAFADNKRSTIPIWRFI